jgi:hypothetical protein
MTKKALEKRLNAHLVNTHGFVEHPLFPGVQATDRSVSKVNFVNLQRQVAALIDHFGLEFKQTESVPSKLVLIKKQKAKA